MGTVKASSSLAGLPSVMSNVPFFVFVSSAGCMFFLLLFPNT